jgi:hypothetical protein
MPDRLFCRLENGTRDELKTLGFDRPQIVVINGMVKKNAELFTDAEYKKNIRDLGDDYLRRWLRLRRAWDASVGLAAGRDCQFHGPPRGSGQNCHGYWFLREPARRST